MTPVLLWLKPMRSWLPVFFLSIVVPWAPARARESCPGVFLAPRTVYLSEVRRAQSDRSAIRERVASDPAWQKADFRRRILKHLFVETFLFVHPDYGPWHVSHPDAASIQNRLTTVLKRIKQVYSARDIHMVLLYEGKVESFAVNWGLSFERGREVLKTLARIEERPAEAAEILAAVLNPSANVVTKIQAQEAKKEKATEQKRVPKQRRSLKAIATVRAVYHDLRMYSLLLKLKNRVVGLHRQLEAVPAKVTADTAFDRAWDDWLAFVQQAETSIQQPSFEKTIDRISRYNSLLETATNWEMPNGEFFAGVLKEPIVLTPARETGVRAGLELKRAQLELMTKELDWIQYDLERLTERGPRSNSLTVDDALSTAHDQLTENLGNNLGSLRQLTEDRQDDLAVFENFMTSGEGTFRRFIERMNSNE